MSPYVDDTSRKHVDGGMVPLSAGELSFALTRVLTAYLPMYPSFSQVAEVVGVLEATKLELWHRVGRPLEDEKRAANGDVFPKEMTRGK